MVQIIPRAKPTFGEQVAGGITAGGQQGADIAKLFLQKALEGQNKEKDLQRKLAAVQQFKKSPGYENLTPMQKFALEQEIGGSIGTGSSKSLINAEREQIGHERFNEAMKKFYNENANSPSEDIESFEPSFDKPTQKKGPDYDTKIRQLQLALASTTNPGEKASLESGIKELQNLREQEIKKSQFELEPLKKGIESFFTKNYEDIEKLPVLENSVEAMMDAVLSGSEDPFSQAHFGEIAKAFGVPPALATIFENPHSKEFNTARKTYLGNTLKENFRGATTSKEIDLAESLLAQAGVTKEGNLASIFLLQSDLMLRKERLRLTEEAQNKGISNYQVPNYVNKNLQEFRKKIGKQYIEAVKQLANKKK